MNASVSVESLLLLYY